MDRLCDEIIHLILYELDDPSQLILASKRLHHISQDPFVRAHYFLVRYGHVEALYWAFTRGRLVSPQMLDILVASGAHLSRYLVQVAIQYYFRVQKHTFIKAPWVRSLSFSTFTHFQKMAADRYGDLSVQKGEDDGSIFATFLRERKYAPNSRSITWDKISAVFETNKFIPFCSKDPYLSQLPLAFAVEPRLIPLAVANGFVKDSKYRDFVFRKMFEKTSSVNTPQDIINNITEMCRVDPDMFLTRTVASEVLMDLNTNEDAYTALKKMGRAGQLRFDLPTLTQDLIRSFYKSSAVTSNATKPILKRLFTDFPSEDPVARYVMIAVVFIPAIGVHGVQVLPPKLRAELDALKLVPTRQELMNVLFHPFMDRLRPVTDYLKSNEGLRMNKGEVDDFAKEAAVRCLELTFKGKMFRKLCESHPSVKEHVESVVLSKYRITHEDVPSWTDTPLGSAPSVNVSAKLAYDSFFTCLRLSASDLLGRPSCEGEGIELIANGAARWLHERKAEPYIPKEPNQLGEITQESLSRMILIDELQPMRSRRRRFHASLFEGSSRPLLPELIEHVPIQTKTQFGAKSPVTATFFTHAIINNNGCMIHNMLFAEKGDKNNSPSTEKETVSITLDHFKILAALGQSPSSHLMTAIADGAPFHESDDSTTGFKEESMTPEPAAALATPSPPPSNGRKKRLRRPAQSISYAVPGSDDEAIMEEDEEVHPSKDPVFEKKLMNLQKWISALDALLKSEQRKLKEYRKKLEKVAQPDMKLRICKTEFMKTVTCHLTSMRKTEQRLFKRLYGDDAILVQYSDTYDDDEYIHRPKSKRARLSA